MEFELMPRTGAGPLRFGMLRADVRSTMFGFGFPLNSEHLTLDHFCESAIRIEYTDETLSFIEFSCHDDIVPRYRGVDALSVTAEELFTLIASLEGGSPHVYDPLEYLFPEQIVALWQADSQYDCRTHQTRVVWGTVGLGDTRYLQAARALEGGG